MPASASRIQVGSGERRLLLLLSALVAFGPLSIDMYLPSLPAIAADLGASDAQVQRSISGFLVGFCVGMLFYGPLSDRFGRRPVLLAGIALYLFSSLACALADSAGQLVLLRVLQALGGGAASVLARAMVRDLYPLGEAARMLALMHMVTMLAPLAAPLLGGYLMLWAGWRALFVVLALFAGLCLLAVWRVAESHPPERRGGSLAQAFLAYGRLLGDRRALGYVLCMGLAFAGMFAYISAAPFVFIEHFGVRAERFGWFFGLNILGVMLATWCSARLVRRHGPRPLLRAAACWAACPGCSSSAMRRSASGAGCGRWCPACCASSASPACSAPTASPACWRCIPDRPGRLRRWRCPGSSASAAWPAWRSAGWRCPACCRWRW